MCGAVGFEADGPFIGLISCHCKECQRLHGNYNPLLIMEKTGFRFTRGESQVRWYDSSPGNQRGFCSVCGAALFKRDTDGAKMKISAGCIDDTSDLVNKKNVNTENAGRYYVMPPEA